MRWSQTRKPGECGYFTELSNVDEFGRLISQTNSVESDQGADRDP